MSAIGGLIRGTPDDPHVISQTKDPALQSAIDAYLTQYKTNAPSNASDLDSFISVYQAQQGAAENNAGQESANIDRFYNGDVSSELAGLRQQASSARSAAGKQALDYALRGRNSSLLSGGATGDSSYNTRLGIKEGNDILIQNALADSADQRKDMSYLEQARLALTGKRQAINDAVMQRLLVPAQARNAAMAANASQLGSFQQLNNTNKFYGLKQDPNVIADFFDNFANDINSAEAAARGGSPNTLNSDKSSQLQGLSSAASPGAYGSTYDPNGGGGADSFQGPGDTGGGGVDGGYSPGSFGGFA